MGSEERLYNETFVRLMQEVMAPLYEGYVRVSNEYAKAKHGVTAQADAEWENYVSELRRRNLSPYGVAINARLRRNVSNQLRVRVPGQKGFADAERQVVFAQYQQTVVRQRFADGNRLAALQFDMPGEG